MLELRKILSMKCSSCRQKIWSLLHSRSFVDTRIHEYTNTRRYTKRHEYKDKHKSIIRTDILSIFLWVLIILIWFYFIFSFILSGDAGMILNLANSWNKIPQRNEKDTPTFLMNRWRPFWGFEIVVFAFVFLFINLMQRSVMKSIYCGHFTTVFSRVLLLVK